MQSNKVPQIPPRDKGKHRLTARDQCYRIDTELIKLSLENILFSFSVCGGGRGESVGLCI